MRLDIVVINIGKSSDRFLKAKFYHADFRCLPGDHKIRRKRDNYILHHVNFMSGVLFAHEFDDVFLRFGLERLGGHLDSGSQLIRLPLHLLGRLPCNLGSRPTDHLTADAGRLVIV